MNEFLQIFENELSRRKLKNPRYSLRAFAKHLGIDPSALSRAFTQKQIAPSACVKLMKRMPVELTYDEKLHYLERAVYAGQDRLLKRLAKEILPN